jgi:integrase
MGQKKRVWTAITNADGHGGVRYREHETRKHGAVPDRYYAISYWWKKENGEGKKAWLEGVGWASEDVKPSDCFALLEILKRNQKLGKGPCTLKSLREHEQKMKEAEDRDAKQRAERVVTLHEYFHQNYLSTAQKKKKPGSWGREVSLFNNWIDPLLGHLKIQEVGITQWDFILSAMVDGGLSPRTRQYACLTLRLVLEHAFARRMVSEMPPRAKLIGATLKPNSNRRTRTVTNQELQSILELLRVRDQHAYWLTLFCALSCCRFSEAANLEWGDIDLAVGRAMFRNTKNGTSREIPLSDTLVDMLLTVGKARGKGRVFLSAQGKEYKQAPSVFRDVVEELGLNQGRNKLDRLVFHSLRHSGATKLGQSGIPLRDMMDLAGWKTPSMALRYQHSGDVGRRRAMMALEGMMQPENSNVIEFNYKKKS